MDTSRVGNLSQAKVVSRLVELGYAVFVPFGDGEKVDIEDNQPIRVQVKTGRLKEGVIEFNCYTSTRNKQRSYYRGIVDVFMVYCPQLDKLYRVPIEVVAKDFGRLRITDSRSRKDARMASDFEI